MQVFLAWNFSILWVAVLGKHHTDVSLAKIYAFFEIVYFFSFYEHL